MVVTSLTQRSSVRAPRQGGFSLLELIIAVTILVLFVTPVLHIVHESRIRAYRYSLKREVQDLAQQKLFERIYSYAEDLIQAAVIEETSGIFDNEGHPDWSWEIPYPEIVSQGEQVLLEYTIFVYVPQLKDETVGGGSGGGSPSDDEYSSENDSSDRDFMDGQANFEMTTWVFPSEFWYQEQEQFSEMGVQTGYGFGNPLMQGGGYGYGY